MFSEIKSIVERNSWSNNDDDATDCWLCNLFQSHFATNLQRCFCIKWACGGRRLWGTTSLLGWGLHSLASTTYIGGLFLQYCQLINVSLWNKKCIYQWQNDSIKHDSLFHYHFHCASSTEAGERQKVMKVFCENPLRLIPTGSQASSRQDALGWINSPHSI